MARYCLIGGEACSTQSLQTSSGSFEWDQKLQHSHWRGSGRGLMLGGSGCVWHLVKKTELTWVPSSKCTVQLWILTNVVELCNWKVNLHKGCRIVSAWRSTSTLPVHRSCVTLCSSDGAKRVVFNFSLMERSFALRGTCELMKYGVMISPKRITIKPLFPLWY